VRVCDSGSRVRVWQEVRCWCAPVCRLEVVWCGATIHPQAQQQTTSDESYRRSQDTTHCGQRRAQRTKSTGRSEHGLKRQVARMWLMCLRSKRTGQASHCRYSMAHKVDFMSRTEAAHLPCVTERYRGRVCLSALSCRYDAARDCAGYIRDHIRNRQKYMCELGGLGWWVSTCSTNASQTFHGSSTSLALSEWRLKTQMAREAGGCTSSARVYAPELGWIPGS
jgi:hypothetical protein